MAFELSELNPTSVPINLLNPRDGTKFGDRPLMDAWEVVKWVAIFRLIIPGALFRLCGGRVENLGDLQPLAVKAGLNGVMMGNFLTTLGAEPEDDRAMFEELGLNVARQEDNGANPRPDNRSGWLEGETPATPIDELIDHQDEAELLGPVDPAPGDQEDEEAPALPGADAASVGRDERSSPSGWRSSATGASTGGCGWSRARRGRASSSTASRCCCSARTTTSGSPTTRRARRRGGGGLALGRRRRRLAADLGQHDAAPRARASGWPRSRATRRRCSSAPATSPTPARSRPSPARGDRRLLRRAQPRQHHRRLPAGRGPRPSSTATATSSTSPGACARPAARPR